VTRTDKIRRRRQEVVTRVVDNDRMGKTKREDDKDEEVLALAILGEPGCGLERQWRKMLENASELQSDSH